MAVNNMFFQPLLFNDEMMNDETTNLSIKAQMQ